MMYQLPIDIITRIASVILATRSPPFQSASRPYGLSMTSGALAAARRPARGAAGAAGAARRRARRARRACVCAVRDGRHRDAGGDDQQDRGQGGQADILQHVVSRRMGGSVRKLADGPRGRERGQRRAGTSTCHPEVTGKLRRKPGCSRHWSLQRRLDAIPPKASCAHVTRVPAQGPLRTCAKNALAPPSAGPSLFPKTRRILHKSRRMSNLTLGQTL